MDQLRKEAVLHVDETGVNIGGRKHWLHTACSDRFTLFMPHAKRGKEAMDAMGVLANYTGTLVHDHWKPYYRYTACTHALCNAHHLRELERAWEQDNMRWAKRMQEFLLELNRHVDDAGGMLGPPEADRHRKRYRRILRDADRECPPSEEQTRKPGQRGRMKRSTARNLLERLRAFEDDVLRFMVDNHVPFTNNQGENDLRMTKVQKKISGCFCSENGAAIFCRIRSYIATCRKHGVTASEALRLLFSGEVPAFMADKT